MEPAIPPRANRSTSRAGSLTIGVEGYKSIRDRVELEIRPLTLLAGANSSGKTSVIQPLLLVKQTLEASFDPGPLLLHGPNVRFHLFEEMNWSGTGSAF